jgi:hypothetical protein
MFRSHHPIVLSLALISCAALTACGPADVNTQGAGAPSDAPRGMDGGDSLPDAGPVPQAGGVTRPAAGPAEPGGQTCAMEVYRAERPSVDLLLLLDVSISMEERIPGDVRRKGDLIREALTSFVKDPRSAGLGVGLRLFPAQLPDPPPPPPAGSSCQSDAECGPHTECRHPDRWCPIFAPGASSPFSFAACLADLTGGPPICPGGGMCEPRTRCALTKGLCGPPGQPCPSGVPGDICGIPPRQCLRVQGGSACATSSYEKPAVPIGVLPGSEPPLAQALQNLTYAPGGTPMGPALAAALAHARAQQVANPTHQVALVLATDGLPTGCQPGDAAGISALVAAEAMRAPSISTYAIGVFGRDDRLAGSPLLERVATAGGTGKPFVLNSDPDLARSFLDSLEKIRQSTLPCAFVIPRPSGPIDFGRVNLRWQSAAGTAEEIPYVAAANRCDPMRGGWYYDVDPASGTPTRVLTCPASCDRLQARSDATVSLVFGCRTVTID